jgi:DNA-directed RNA polymerase specialized sigma subunit
VFDADDARQEAAIACWQSGKDMAVVGYRGILDAMRKLVPGFRQQDQILCSEVEDIRTHYDSPEAIVSARQIVDQIEGLPDQQRVIVAAALDGEPVHVTASAMGVTDSRVSQIRVATMRTLTA